jgi:hypothetical protein
VCSTTAVKTVRRAARAVTAVGVVLVGLRALIACGARTPLDVNPPPDAGKDVARDQFVLDVLPDIDAGFDAPPDVLPDVPMIDVNPLPDVVVQGCVDAGATQIYLITSENILYSFYPLTLAITAIGMISCPVPDPESNTPFSMAVNRTGTAFSVFQEGNLEEISTATAACIPTPYVPDQQGIINFGMGYVGNSSVDAGETLYVAANSIGNPAPMVLGTINTTTFTLNIVGSFQPVSAELTGTGDGRLFAFWAPGGEGTPGSAVSQVDPATAQIIATTPLPTVTQGEGWAFAFWGGDFYLFTGTGSSDITRFDPIANTVTVVGSVPNLIVGAGVSTCAPMQ